VRKNYKDSNGVEGTPKRVWPSLNLGRKKAHIKGLEQEAPRSESERRTKHLSLGAWHHDCKKVMRKKERVQGKDRRLPHG